MRLAYIVRPLLAAPRALSKGQSLFEGRYAYSSRFGGGARTEDAGTESAVEAMLAIRDCVKGITGGCGSCLFLDGRFCGKHGMEVEDDHPRCDFFLRRTMFSQIDDSRDPVQAYVNDILGIKGKNLKRFVR